MSMSLLLFSDYHILKGNILFSQSVDEGKWQKRRYILFSFIFLCSYNDEKPKDDESPSKYFVFEGADVDVTYTVKVTLVLNGKTIASSQKTIKSVTKKTEDEELGIKEYI